MERVVEKMSWNILVASETSHLKGHKKLICYGEQTRDLYGESDMLLGNENCCFPQPHRFDLSLIFYWYAAKNFWQMS